MKAGGTLRTAIGILAIDAVDPVPADTITTKDARAAGFSTLAHLKADLAQAPEGTLYRVAFRVAGADPRVALAADARLSREAMAELRAAIEKLDSASPSGPWTERVLQLLAENDGMTAAEIAATLAVDKDRLKRDMRKLKEEGLTESLARGYRISPRGRAALARLGEDG